MAKQKSATTGQSVTKAPAAKVVAAPENCNSCKFFKASENKIIQYCHRYPTPVNTSPSHWCGEYVVKKDI